MRMIQRYTLMEILVVAAIIAILAGIAIPGAMTARRYARESAAVAEIQSIATAMKRFEAEYGEGVYPAPSYTWVETTPLPTEKYDAFFNMLTGFNGTNAVTDWGNNKKHIKFLDPKANGGKFVFKSGNDSKEYQIFVDVDGDGKIDLSSVAGSPGDVVLASVVIFVKTDPTKNRFATSWGGIIQRK